MFQVFSINKDQFLDLKNQLLKAKFKEKKQNSIYIFWSGIYNKNIITIYKSGKVVLDIKSDISNIKEILQNFTDQEINSNLDKKQDHKNKLLSQNTKSSQKLSKIKTSKFKNTGFKYTIGCDETGTGEVFGRVIVGSLILSQEDQKLFEEFANKFDTKKISKNSVEHFLEIEKKIESFKIPYIYNFLPIENKLFDKPKMKNKLMDEYYKKIIQKNIDILNKEYKVIYKDIQIILDDYKPTIILRSYFSILQELGISTIIQTKADDTFIPVRICALFTRIQRSKEIQEFNIPKYEINGIMPGNGNTSLKQTTNWLKYWWNKNKSFPDFVKQWFKTAQLN